MRFEHPNVLWAFLLLSIPIIIHLFHFKRFKTLYFSSLIFVKQVEQETKSVKKLKHLLILISRLLAFSFLVIAFAKPYLPLGNDLGNQKTNAIYIDNSFSMTNLGTNGQLFEIAKAQARDIVSKMNDDESFYIVSNNLSPLEQKKYNKKEAIDRINQLNISPVSKDFSEISNWIQMQIEKEGNDKLERLIYLSDFQNDSISSNLLLNKTTSIYPIQLVSQKSNNIAIDSAWFTTPNFSINTMNELNVVLRNYGKDKVENIALNLKTNQTQRDIFVNIPANDTSVITINYTDSKPDWVLGKLSIFDEGIIFDDDLYFSYKVQNHSNVTIIDGEDAVKNVALVYELEPYYQLHTINSNSIDNEKLQHANTIVLNGLNSYSSGLIETLANKAKNGSSIIIFPGNSPKITELNQLLSELKLGTVRDYTSEKFRITQLNKKDAFFKSVFSKIPQTLTLPTLYQYLKINQSASIIPLLTLENGDPALIHSTSYNTFLFTSALSKEFSNLTTDPIFSSILLRVGEISTNQQPIYTTIGSKQKYAVQQTNPENAIRLKAKQYEFIPMKTFDLGKSFLSIITPEMNNITSGWYDILENDNSLGHLSLNYNRAESNNNFVSVNDVKESLNRLGYEDIHENVLTNSTAISLINTNNKKEYWKVLLILALLFFVTEMALIKFWK